MDARQVCTGRNKARHKHVLGLILSRNDEHGRLLARAAVGPPVAGREPGDDVHDECRFADAREAHELDVAPRR